MEERTVPRKINLDPDGSRRMRKAMRLAEGKLSQVGWAISKALSDLDEYDARKGYLMRTLNKEIRIQIASAKKPKSYHTTLDALKNARRQDSMIPDSDK